MSGRPTVYKEDYCAMLIEHCKEGLSRESFAAVIDVNKDTLYEWKDRHAAFSEAWHKSKIYRQKALEMLVMKHATGRTKGSTAAALFMLKNIAPEHYKDRTEVEYKTTERMDLDELKKEAARLLQDLNESSN